VRQGGSIGLPERDVEFHNRHFGRATDVMLILNARETQDLSIEVFAPSLNVPLSPQEFRWGSFHLNSDTPLTRPNHIALEERHKRDDLGVPHIAVAAASGVPADTLAHLTEAPSPRTNRLLWLMSAVLFVLAISMTFA
jgi:hypothetical protein